MTIPLDVITHKKLVLVRQLYQRAVLQGEAQHSYVDRIMALIGLDLTNETVLKTIVGAVTPGSQPKSDFQGILKQADAALIAVGLPAIPDVPKIQHVRSLRNDAQHKAKYPNDSDVNDCRTYTRDFLQQVIQNTWGTNFESVSLVEAIQNDKVRTYLHEAETDLAGGDYVQAVLNTIAAFEWAVSKIKSAIAGKIPYYTKAIVVSDTFGRQSESVEVFRVFEQMQNTVMRSVIGVSFPGYLRFQKIKRSVGSIVFMEDGHYQSNFHGYTPTAAETEYVIEFATNAVLQIESLVGDIEKPFDL